MKPATMNADWPPWLSGLRRWTLDPARKITDFALTELIAKVHKAYTKKSGVQAMFFLLPVSLLPAL